MLDINLTLPIQIVLFLIFAWLMNQVFFRPVTRVLEERQDYLRQQQEQADAALGQAEALQADYETRLKAVHSQSQDTIQAAIKEAEARRQAELAGVQAQVAAEVESARAAIRAEREEAVRRLEGEVGSFAELIKRKVLGGAPAYSAARGTDA